MDVSVAGGLGPAACAAYLGVPIPRHIQGYEAQLLRLQGSPACLYASIQFTDIHKFGMHSYFMLGNVDICSISGNSMHFAKLLNVPLHESE